MLEPTLPTMLDRAALSGRGLWFVDHGEKEKFVPYREVRERARRTASGLGEWGIGRGDRVAVILPTCPEFFDAFFGIAYLGAVPVPLYPPVRLGRMDEYHLRTVSMLKACRARLLLTDRRVRLFLGKTIQGAALELGARLVSDVPTAKTGAYDGSADDPALIQFSSGTYSSPKPVRLTHRQIIANVEAIRGAILNAYPEGNGLTHRGASWLPLYHDMGLIGSVLTALAHPSDLVLMPPELFVSRPSIWLRTISRFRATVSAAPNFAYSLCAERVEDGDLEGVDLSSWRVAFNGAEPVTPLVLDRFVERFRRFGLAEDALTPVYGLAEAALAVTFSPLDRRFTWEEFDRKRLVTEYLAVPAAGGHRIVSVGQALPGYEIRIVDEAWRDLPPNRIGRVVVRGPSVMDEYDGRGDLTRPIRRGEWLDTGDVGFMHRGDLFLYGRNKDLIILRGRNYAPDDVEQALDGLSGLRPGCRAAIGIVSEEGTAEELILLVERSRDRDSEADEELAAAIRSRIVERIGVSPSRILVLEPGTLPRTSSGKIRRREVKRRLLDGSLRPPKSANLFGVASELIRSRFDSFRKARHDTDRR